jgi:hypothetical protein
MIEKRSVTFEAEIEDLPAASQYADHHHGEGTEAGFKFLGVVAGQTAFGGKEVINILQKVER